VRKKSDDKNKRGREENDISERCAWVGLKRDIRGGRERERARAIVRKRYMERGKLRSGRHRREGRRGGKALMLHVEE